VIRATVTASTMFGWRGEGDADRSTPSTVQVLCLFNLCIVIYLTTLSVDYTL